MKIFSGVSRIVAAEAFQVAANGLIVTDAAKIVQDGETLKIGCESSISGNVTLSGGGTIITNSSYGGSSMTMNGIGIRTVGNKIMLTGPADKILVVNGVQTTFGAVRAGSTASADAPREECRLNGDVRIKSITATGVGECFVHEIFVAQNLQVSIAGAASVHLPAHTFESLQLQISGSGDITGKDFATKTALFTATIAGSGDISEITVLNAGSATIAGSGDILIEAVDPSKIARQAVGSGNIRVRKARVQESLPTVSEASSGKKRSFAGESGGDDKRAAK